MHILFRNSISKSYTFSNARLDSIGLLNESLSSVANQWGLISIPWLIMEEV